jgi:hypothetical protein
MMEKADAILIQTSDSPKNAYQKMYKLLIKKGFGIASEDDRAHTLLTTPYDLKKAADDTLASSSQKAQFYVNIREDEQTIILLRGRYGYENTSMDYQFDNRRIAGSPFSIAQGGEINNTETDKSLARLLGWKLMMDVAGSYPGGQLYYARNR